MADDPRDRTLVDKIAVYQGGKAVVAGTINTVILEGGPPPKITSTAIRRYVVSQILLSVGLLVVAMVIAELITLGVFGLMRNQVANLEAVLNQVQRLRLYHVGNYLNILISLVLVGVIIGVIVLSFEKAQRRMELAKADLEEMIKGLVVNQRELITERVVRGMAYGVKLKHKSPALVDKAIAECIRMAGLEILRENTDQDVKKRLTTLNDVLQVFDKEGPPLLMVNHFNRLYACAFSGLSRALSILSIQLLLVALGAYTASQFPAIRWLVDAGSWVFPAILVWLLLSNLHTLDYWRGKYAPAAEDHNADNLLFQLKPRIDHLKHMVRFYFDRDFNIKMATKETGALRHLPILLWTASWERFYMGGTILITLSFVLGWLPVLLSQVLHLGPQQIFTIIVAALILVVFIEVAVCRFFLGLHDYESLRIRLLKAELQLTQRRFLRGAAKNQVPPEADFRRYQRLCDLLWAMTGDETFRKEVNHEQRMGL